MPPVLKLIRNTLSSPAWICFVWFGMTAGVSLLATPARFSAPLITRPIAFDVTSTVFQVLNKAELMALVVLLIVVRASGRAARWWALCGILTLILIAQSAWLIPELSERAALVAQGRELPPSIAHAAYSTLELVKLSLLFAAGVVASGSQNR
ncbi:MAG: hypothetical protein AAF660_04255 [Pseudomonadota bacterium]